MPDARQLLEQYVAAAKVMQLATVDDTGAPQVCNLWFASSLNPDRLWFISRPNRNHCEQLRKEDRVAGAILDTVLDELGGSPVRGISFSGRAVELPTTGVDEEIGVYLSRWPKAANAIDPQRLAAGETHHRIYQITVDSWILFDEIHSVPPRQPVAAQQ